jgi:hypothetical protein
MVILRGFETRSSTERRAALSDSDSWSVGVAVDLYSRGIRVSEHRRSGADETIPGA